MKFRPSRWPVLLALAAAVVTGSGPPGCAQELSLPDLWRLAADQSLTLQEQRQQIESAKRDLAIQKASRLPVVSASGTHNYISEVAQFELPFVIPGRPPVEITAGTHQSTDLALIVQQPLFTGFRLRNSVRAASEQVEAQRWAYRTAASRVFLQVGQLYYTLQRNLLHQEVLKESIRRAELHLQRARALLDAQQIAPFDTLEVAN
ncbi:MAG: TolC family protein, partial [Calditrichaeota bacterium]|nr:TolC family protein [Calditrichota bacterium]